jgi:hypothetical protein
MAHLLLRFRRVMLLQGVVVVRHEGGREEPALLTAQIREPTGCLIDTEGEHFVALLSHLRTATPTEVQAYWDARLKFATEIAIDEHLRLIRNSKN